MFLTAVFACTCLTTFRLLLPGWAGEIPTEPNPPSSSSDAVPAIAPTVELIFALLCNLVSLALELLP